MHTQLARPDQISSSDLDDWLERGWYRVGQILMTCRFVLNDTGLRSAVWTRVPLDGYRFKRSHRKLLSKVDRAFELVEGPARPDPLREDLYARYLATVKGERAASLTEFLGRGERERFDTQELAMWEGDRLVGFSWFDMGERSIQSLIAVYDPDYRKMSLGFTTLLLEMRVGMREGLDYHYAGYVLPGDPTMDYKLRPRPIEFFDEHAGDWRPWEELGEEHLPAERIQARLDEARSRLADIGIAATRFEYPPYGLRSTHMPQLLGEPVALRIGRDGRASTLLVFDVEQESYRVLTCYRAWAQRVGPDNEPLEPIEVMVRIGEECVSTEVEDIVDYLDTVWR